ncbi:MAG: hypothetical protein ACJAXH_001780 [Colwellia sp.]|jgi:hypothetical protein
MGKISDTPTLYLYQLTTKVNQLNCEKITILFSINNVISIFKAILIQKYIFQIIVRLATNMVIRFDWKIAFTLSTINTIIKVLLYIDKQLIKKPKYRYSGFCLLSAWVTKNRV